MGEVHGVAIDRLRPTQITVGKKEVHDKAKELEEKRDHPHHLKEFFAKHMIPVVEGPEDKYFVIDHHHLGCAMLEAKVDGASLEVKANLAKLSGAAFWQEMDRQKWVHPYDEQGHKKSFEDIPHHLSQLIDDPYRSLAAYVRNAGGFKKIEAPFAEFLWADFFRTRIDAELLKGDLKDAVLKALPYAGCSAAKSLPGYIDRE